MLFKVRGAFVRLEKFQSSIVFRRNKAESVYKTLVVSVLLYERET